MHPSASRIALFTAGLLLVGTPLAGQRPPVPAAPVARDLAPVPDDAQRSPAPAIEEVVPAANSVEFFAGARFHGDVLALERYRPGYRFWTHVFSNPDGSIVFGSAETGALVASFPTRGDWAHEGRYFQDGIESLVSDRSFPRRLSDRRDRVAELIEPYTGPVIHNPTRGNFVSPNIDLYGGFLEEWGRIYERFGVPADLGLAQALVESGFSGDVKSEARAIGFCQFLPRNWRRLDRLTDHVIEVENQTTQAAYCACLLYTSPSPRDKF